MIFELGNSLRVIVERTDGNVTYMGMLANAGSRYDGHHDGLAHFVEHTIFKGTPKRKSWQVSNRMELIGGELNAYTTKEEIMVYTTAPAGYEGRGAELLGDLLANACFPETEVDRERGVVLEEIDSYRDNPSYAVFDDFDERFFAGTPLAHNILGYPETVKAITSRDAADFLHTYFRGGNMTAYCLTPGDPEKTARILERHFSQLPEGPAPVSPTPEAAVKTPLPFAETIDKGRHQANTVMGAPVDGRKNPDRYALFLLSSILGGPAMNSRLNRELREKRGLVYSVETSVPLYADRGAFQVYFGCDHKAVGKCERIVRGELAKLADKELSAKAFNQAVEQVCGQLLVSGDNREARAMMLAKTLLRYGEAYDTARQAEKIRSLTAADLRQAAQTLSQAGFSRLTLR